MGRKGKFEIVTQRDDERTDTETLKKRSRKKRVIIIVIVVLFIVLIVGAIVGFLAWYLTRGKDTAKSSEFISSPVKGQWSRWDPWSPCDRTCDEGNQMRWRYCNDPEPEQGGAQCVGPDSEMRKCAQFECPDCSRTCPDNGTLQDCSVCMCANTTVQGEVRIKGGGSSTADNDPTSTAVYLSYGAARIYIKGREWDPPLATTVENGRFFLNNLCFTGLKIVVKAPGYLDSEASPTVMPNNPEESVVHVQMEPIVKPRFIKHPSSVATFVGRSIEFKCAATGTPEPYRYFWYKDGDLILRDVENDQSDSLAIPSTSLQDEGVYRCQAESNYAKVYSNKAVLTVKEGGEDTCTSEPESRFISLPPSCITKTDTKSSVDVGTCGRSTCSLADNTSSVSSCCGAVATENVDITCDNFNYQISRITKCGCTECYGDNKYTKLTIQLFLQDQNGDIEDAPGCYVYYKNNIIGTYQQSTKFDFDVPSDEEEKVVLTFARQSSASRTFFPQSKVLYFSRGSETSYDIILQKAPAAITYAGTEAVSVSLGNNSTSLFIPPLALVDKRGNPHTENVDLYPVFLDPKSSEGLSGAPGEFTFDDEEGDVAPLQTFGVIGINAESRGRSLHIAKPITVSIDKSKMDIPTDASLWSFNRKTGNWDNPQPLSKTDRQKRQTSPPAITGNITIPYDIPYLNIDKPLLRGRMCVVDVGVYQDKLRLAGVPGILIRVYTKTADGNQYLGYTSQTTNYKGRVCVSIPCGYKHVILASSGPAANASTVHHLPDGYEFTNIVDKKSLGIEFTSPSVSQISELNGPVYRYVTNMCGSNKTKNYHFQFILGKLDYQRYVVEERPNMALSWYPEPANSKDRTACLAKIAIRTTDDQTEVVAVSRQGSSSGPLYGTFFTGVQKLDHRGMPQRRKRQYYIYQDRLTKFACIEFRCPKDKSRDDLPTPSEPESTYVDVKILSTDASKCKYSQNGRAEVPVQIDTFTNSSLTFKVSSSFSEGVYKNFGTYSSAFYTSLTYCQQDYSGYVALFDCAGPTR